MLSPISFSFACGLLYRQEGEVDYFFSKGKHSFFLFDLVWFSSSVPNLMKKFRAWDGFQKVYALIVILLLLYVISLRHNLLDFNLDNSFSFPVRLGTTYLSLIIYFQLYNGFFFYNLNARNFKLSLCVGEGG